ncbi:hypothetical protein KM043_013756 [Ampulex compressa]|nr:hypothetical protein KM043_013756 [Ampulex compressa]
MPGRVPQEASATFQAAVTEFQAVARDTEECPKFYALRQGSSTKVVVAPHVWRRSLPRVASRGGVASAWAHASTPAHGGDVQCHFVPGVAAPWPLQSSNRSCRECVYFSSFAESSSSIETKVVRLSGPSPRRSALGAATNPSDSLEEGDHDQSRRSSLSFSLPAKQYLVRYRRKDEGRRRAPEAGLPGLAANSVGKCATVKGNGGFGDYSAAGEFEVWGDEHHAADGLERQVARPPSRQQRCEGGSTLRPLLHVAHCELHSPREAELLRLDHLEGLDHKSLDHDSYSMMDNFHSPVPPPLPRRHVRPRPGLLNLHGMCRSASGRVEE